MWTTSREIEEFMGAANRPLYFNEKCRFMGKEVRENRGHFVPFTVRFPLSVWRNFDARISKYYPKMYSAQLMQSSVKHYC